MDNREYSKVVNDCGNFFKDYSKTQYGDDWKMCMSWNLGWKMKDSSKWKKIMERLKYYVLGLGIGVSVFDSVYVTEYNSDLNNLHLHSMIYVDGNKKLVKDKLWKYCSNKGSVDIVMYEEDLGFDFYMSKYLYVKGDNNWGILGYDI